MFQMRSLYFALNILMILISNVSATKCGVIAPDCQVFGDGTIQWEQSKKCPLMPICQRGFRFISDIVNGETRCCCMSDIPHPTYDLPQSCPPGKWWNYDVYGCDDIPISSEAPCQFQGCQYNSNGECVCCKEFSYWDPSLQKCAENCSEIYGCAKDKITSTSYGICKCSQCLPGFFLYPDGVVIQRGPYYYEQCSESCYWKLPCSFNEVWNRDICQCVDILPSSDIPPTSDVPLSSDSPSSGII